MASRVERNPFIDWWWTVDRVLLFLIMGLMITGIVLGFAGSPPVAERLGLPTFHFVQRQLQNLVPAFAIMLFVSFLPLRQLRRTALFIYVTGMVLVVLALIYGEEVKGAQRWVEIFGIAIQPSEFVKPAFVIMVAWAFSEGSKRRDQPGNLIGIMLLFVTITPLVMQPDIGQTMLISIVWAGLMFLAGLHLIWVIGLGGFAVSGLFVAYHLMPHVRQRIDRFLDPQGRDTFQVDTALQSFSEGSWFGKGPGEGTMKRILPDSHTDFIFAVTGEEFGIIACIILLTAFLVLVLRGLQKAKDNEEPFSRLAAAGLVFLFGAQAAINMAVNVKLIPAKGMTLPFISYGGSSLISLGLATGFLLAVTRKRPRAEYVARAFEERAE
jgi:cell division protein FtsW